MNINLTKIVRFFILYSKIKVLYLRKPEILYGKNPNDITPKYRIETCQNAELSYNNKYEKYLL